MPLYNNSEHLSDEDMSLLVDHFDGEVQGAIAPMEDLSSMFEWKTITGMSTVFKRQIGGSVMQRIVPGVAPVANPRAQGKTSLTVDTMVIIRDQLFELSVLQQDMDTLGAIGRDHGITHGKFIDQMLLIQAIKASFAAAPTAQGTQSNTANLRLNFGAGSNIAMDQAADEDDVDLVEAKLDELILVIRNREIPLEEFRLFVKPWLFDVLLKSDRLIHRDFSEGNGDFAGRRIFYYKKVPIFESVRMPDNAIVDHPLSNDMNSAAYDVSATEAKVFALFVHKEAVWAGRSKALETKIWWNDDDKTWIIDSWQAPGAAPNRVDHALSLRTA